jgi:hypothetical protein
MKKLFLTSCVALALTSSAHAASVDIRMLNQAECQSIKQDWQRMIDQFSNQITTLAAHGVDVTGFQKQLENWIQHQVRVTIECGTERKS